MPFRPSYASKVISAGVMVKAVLMGVLVEVLAVGSFTRSIILVLVSATATGIFGLLIVLVQVHVERGLHRRMDGIERQVNERSDQIVQTTEAAAHEAAARAVEQVKP